jgi:hypothetical protein
LSEAIPGQAFKGEVARFVHDHHQERFAADLQGVHPIVERSIAHPGIAEAAAGMYNVEAVTIAPAAAPLNAPPATTGVVESEMYSAEATIADRTERSIDPQIISEAAVET